MKNNIINKKECPYHDTDCKGCGEPRCYCGGEGKSCDNISIKNCNCSTQEPMEWGINWKAILQKRLEDEQLYPRAQIRIIETVEKLLAYQIKQAEERGKKQIEHCSEPECPECNIVAYNKGYKEGAETERQFILNILDGAETERQFILNILDGVDKADKEMERQGIPAYGGTKAIRFALSSRVINQNNE